MTDAASKPGSTSRADVVKYDILALVLLAAAALIYHHRAVLFAEMPRWEDVTENFEPLRAYYCRQLHAGRVPIWAPHLGLGFPMLAQSITGIFYPLNLLFFSLLPHREGALVVWLVRAFLASAFAYAFARALGLKWFSALVPGLVFMLSGFVVAHRWVLPARWAWFELPLMLLAAERIVTRRRTWTVVWASLVYGMSLLVGHYHLQWITLVLYVIYGAVRTIQEGGGPRRLLGTAVRLVLPLLLGFLLAAVQILPSAELKPLSPRAGAGEHQREGGIPYQHLVSYAFPLLFQQHDHYWEQFNTSVVESIAYVGILPLVLAPLAWRRRKGRPAVVALMIGAVLLTLLSFGKWLPGHDLLVRLPGFGFFTHPGRYTFGVSLCLGVLAGFGLETARAASRDDARRWLKRAVQGMVLLGVVGALVLTAEWEWARDPDRPPEFADSFSSSLQRIALSAPAVLVSLAAFWPLLRRRRRAVGLAVVVVAADLMAFGFMFRGQRVAPPCPAWKLSRRGEVLTALARHGLLPESSDLRHAGGPHAGRAVAGYRVLWFSTPFMSVRGHWVHDISDRPYHEVAHLYRAFHVGYLLSHDEIMDEGLELLYEGDDSQIRLLHGPRARTWYLYRLPTSLPRAYLVDQAVWCDTPEMARSRVEDTAFDPARTVFLETANPQMLGLPLYQPETIVPPVWSPGGAGHGSFTDRLRRFVGAGRSQVHLEYVPVVLEAGTTLPSSRSAGPPGTCWLEEDADCAVRIRVHANRGTWLVLSDLCYPGWEAYIGNLRTHIFPANYAGRAVWVPEGEHEIRFVYRPMSVRVGRVVSLATLGMLALTSAALLVGRLRRRAKGAGTVSRDSPA